MINPRFLLTAAASAWAVAAAAGQPVPFTQGNLVVVQVGDGSAALNNSSTAGFLKEVQINGGGVVQTINLPVAAAGANRALTFSGSATSEGFLTLSVDGQYLTLAGYDSAPGVTGIAATPSATVNRVVGRVDSTGAIDSSTAFDAYNAGNIRSAVTTNGADIWTSGTSASTGGVRYVAFGNPATTQLSSTPTNIRVVNIFADQLYAASASGAFQGVSTVGVGLPTTAGQTTTLLPGFPTTTGPSAYDFFFADAMTLYVADDRLAASGGGIQKWTFDAGTSTWTLQYTLQLGAGARGLTGAVTGGVATLYATTAESNGNRLVSITDTDPSAQFVLIAQAAANTAWRGVDFAPVAGTPPVTCYPNCDHSTIVPFLNVLDFNCFLNQFSAGASYANCDGSTIPPVLNVLDFNCFLNSFSAGCSAP